MIDHLVGRPSPSWKRLQVFFVLFFWTWRIVWGDARGPRLLWIRKFNRRIGQKYTPWQVVVSTLTAVYFIRNLDKVLGLGAPEPLARLYSPSYYRATWIVTGLDAGFATAMNIRPKWFRDMCSIVFSVYYIIYANEADEKLRRFRAVPTVEMLRATWNKTTNPIVSLKIRMVTQREFVALCRKILLARPANSPYSRPLTLHLYYKPKHSTDEPFVDLSREQDLILDFPGGGFIAMTPEHHDERLRRWAVKTGKPIISVDYGKAPEYPYPYAIEECFDLYRVLMESKGKAIGMSGKKLNVILTGDSAGAHLAVSVVLKILEHSIATSEARSGFSLPSSLPPQPLPLPVAVVLSYAALDLNFTSWMTPENLRVLSLETEADERRPPSRTPSFIRRRSSSFFHGSDEEEDRKDSWVSTVRGTKDHLSHVSPLAVVGDDSPPRRRVRRKKSWRDSIRVLPAVTEPSSSIPATKPLRNRSRKDSSSKRPIILESPYEAEADGENGEAEDDYFAHLPEEKKPIKARVRWNYGGGYSPISTPLASSPCQSPSISTRKLKDPLGDQEQEKLEAEVVKEDTEVAEGLKRAGDAAKDAPVGTRLTMTSRTGYFQDRVITPSMMRAMAILYIGPHRNPDFASDYHISPILAPARLLAQFPPLLMQCGEKDPFVDDTIIFAGRVREAKRKRKGELRHLIAERRAGPAFRRSEDLMKLEDELETLEASEEDDWVQMCIFPDWSHGYLQMPMLMKEATEVIDDLAKWIEGAFALDSAAGSANGSSSDTPSLATISADATPPTRSGFFSSLWSWNSKPTTDNEAAHSVRIAEPDEYRINTDKHEARARNVLPSETETEAEDIITFVPKSRRTNSIGSEGGASTVSRRSFPPSRRTPPPLVASPMPILSPPKPTTRRSSSRSRTRDAASPPHADGLAGKLEVGTPKGMSAPGRAGVMAQTLTEAELVRRRRLLDSHIFQSESEAK
ncbi:alpha/beta-hydrolase [Peniophora sp. CONT]|nr:alpha/beta-hydrolase [Peniophora sp. CONT]